MFLHGFAYTNGARNLSHLSNTTAKSQPQQNVDRNKCNGSISQSSKLAECTIPEIQSNQNLKMAA